ncbi:MAG: ATP:cob(I)alamin adenosyltransferase [Bdellovibrio sp. CG12_big_fil_rev_8_21_14_0_65_39_13]|nr:MAG: ATP:cob(I)alamin adenosyltransferase [Bdellovibrio sp. CG22_combo_CG10-13_8_21_14_all_39_27]PIQ60680.1 MAG: ATP:cob(I)alamin adenosyltransferase [Bdellovibrio sp. CG12_big_fil_rev_8_21_14_0_65_39_13]PIR37064.1 MAG: ATP:cob(I)alamin adenosyltransferase [Bdellovibrio sp. CG11_big_fil_rev_8_21_14_0_20_39_38]PJB52463.1 MAG: ATP:cob(I)alamin adenosyltransferase [Bdellovibrio sp. CG_4_9_14_3_um_filter_39_7]
MKIYTKTGDQGMTSLIGGTRVSKACDRLEAYGELDELNSWIGFVLAQSRLDKEHMELLLKVQNELFVMGSFLACEPEKRSQFKLPQLSSDLISEMEKLIDDIDSQVEPLTNFILPGGGNEAASIHLARTVTRRAERKIVALANDEELSGLESIVMFLNRLSDYLFVLGRLSNMKNKIKETIWKPGK